MKKINRKLIIGKSFFSKPPSAELQNIQKNLTNIKGVFIGPNTDEINLEDRYDNCHFSGKGLEKQAEGWINAILKSNNQLN